MGLFSKKDASEDDSAQVAPQELPDTAIDKLAGKQATTQKPIDDSHKRIPPEIVHEKAKSRVPVQETHYVNVSHNAPREKPVHVPKEQPVSNHNGSFFEHMEQFLKKKDRHVNNYNSRDLVNKMKDYHESLKTGHSFFLHEADAEDQISRKMDQLKDLESDWIARRKELDAAEMFLAEKELEIETKFEELKSMMSHADKHALFNKKAPEGKKFILVGGKSLSSINELLYELPKMKDDVFNHHVSATKNDFSAWIKWVFDSEELSNAISGSKTRLEMISSLKEF